jgi:multiple sugar transport system permease protein
VGAERAAPGPHKIAEKPRMTGIWLTLPALLILAATMLYPIGSTLWLSLNANSTALRGTPEFVGLANYGRIIANPEFTPALVHPLGLVAVSLAAELVIGFSVALALHRSLVGSKVFRAIVSLPLMVAPVVGALAWRFIFVDGYGLIDSLATTVGGNGPLWFADVWLARATIIIANLWMALPFDILLILAGLVSLPTEPLEAAKVDGASAWQMFWRIILPLLKPVIAVILVIRLADAFRIFDVVYILTGGGPANATDVLSTFVYRQMFTAFDFSGGAAAAILLVLITSAASLLAVLTLRDRSRGS